MRKITREACYAFENMGAGKYEKSNTIVRTDGLRAQMWLHGNLIAYSNPDGIYISNGGWSSNTTKERLNGLTGVHIQQKDFVSSQNGEEWNGDWIKIGD